MKKIILLVLSLAVIFGCDFSSPNSALSGRINFISEVRDNSRSPLENVDGVIISIQDAVTEEMVYDSYRLDLYNLNGQYISESLSLALGTYNLTKFFVVDSGNKVLFASPMEGSALAEYVDNPLPIEFEVIQNVTASVKAQVMPVGSNTADDFGYSIFAFDVVYTDSYYPEVAKQSVYDTGIDGIPDNEDDVKIGYCENHYLNYYSSNTRHFYDPTPDGIWNESEQVPFGWWWARSDTYGSFQTGPGPDGVWFTTDDIVDHWEDWGQDPANLHRIYGDPGLDGVWFTDDDTMIGYYDCTFDEKGNEIKRVNYGSAGPDGIWFNEDDELSPDWFGCYFTREYEGEYNNWGSWIKQTMYIGPGIDGTWFTEDDEISSYALQTFADGTKFFTRQDNYIAGDDGVFFTEDDRVFYYVKAENIYQD
ncbi:MAG: hypothetical protein JW969_10025 [Spirochaetales bacterium]|nr:hypothetical protein [Spirochaetales bacterium]